MVGLVLEGGGAKGSYQAGAYMALKKCHIKVDAVVGTSIGALNGALIASHDEDKMIRLWKDASMNELLGIDEEKAMEIYKGNISLDNVKWGLDELHKFLKNKGLDMSNYRALVRNNIDEDKLRCSNIKYGLTTLKLETMKPIEIFMEDIPRGKLHDYIAASSFLPVFKKEKLVDDSYYLDGGFYNLSPVDMLLRVGCDKIFVINIKGIGIRKPKKKTDAEIIEIKPSDNLGSIIFFDEESTEENMNYGYLDTMKALKKLDGVECYFKKKPEWYYKRLNHKIDKETYKTVSMLLKSTSVKDTVIKALEYVIKWNKLNNSYVYEPKDIINKAKNTKTDNIIYKYVQKLSIF